MKCNRDCFNCPYDDCIEDELELEDYRAEAEMERELLFSKTAAQKKAAARQKAYREANREKVAARQKAWYEANRENWARYMREYRRKKKQKEAAYGE